MTSCGFAPEEKIMTSRGFAPGGMTLHLEEIGKMTTGHSVTTPWIKLH